MLRTRRAGWVLVVGLLFSVFSFSVSSQAPTQSVLPGAPAADDVINPDRPGIADGSTVIGRGRFQLETGFQHELRDEKGDEERTIFVPTLFRVGLSDRWEARFEGNTFTTITSGANRTTDVAPVSVGMKFQIQNSAGRHQPSLGTILRVFPPSGSGDLHTNHTTGDLRLAADWDLTSKLSLNPNAGVAFYEDEAGARFVAGLFALTLNYFNATKTINPFVDIGIQTPEGSATGTAVIIDGGLAYLPGRNVQIDVSAGTGANGQTPPHPFFSIGLSLRFHTR